MIINFILERESFLPKKYETAVFFIDKVYEISYNSLFAKPYGNRLVAQLG